MKRINLLALVVICYINLQAQTIPPPEKLHHIQETNKKLEKLETDVRRVKGSEPANVKSFVVSIIISKKEYKDKDLLNRLLDTGSLYLNYAASHRYDRIVIRVTRPGIFTKTSHRVIDLHKQQ